jgi:hypothetical protein
MFLYFFYLLTDRPLENNGAGNVFESSVSIDQQTHSLTQQSLSHMHHAQISFLTPPWLHCELSPNLGDGKGQAAAT